LSVHGAAVARDSPGNAQRDASKKIFFQDGSTFPFPDADKPLRWPKKTVKRHPASYFRKKPEMKLRVKEGFGAAHSKK
jgi:hypothetical protein